MAKQQIGYIGLGNMGGGMAAHLLNNGYPVTVYDLNPQAVQALVEKGATAAGSPKAVAEQCEVIISSLPTPKSVEQAALGPNGIVAGLTAGKIYIDMSTIDPETTRKVGEAVAEKGADMLDVPVGNGPPEAASGGLILMVGGDANVAERCKDVLDTLGSESFYCGGLGMGVTTKLVNNLVTCSVTTLMCEALTLGVAAGLDPDQLRNVMINTGADNRPARTILPQRAMARNFDAKFKLALSHKDLRLAAQLATSLGVPNMMGSTALQVQTLGMGKGLGNEDQSAVIKVVEEVAGVVVKSSSPPSS